MLLPVLAATGLTLLIGLLLAFTARLNAILPRARQRPQRRRGLSIDSRFLSDGSRRSRRLDRARRDSVDKNALNYSYKHITVVLGSGGHTAEMLLMLEDAKMWKWRKRTWVVSSGDRFSASLATEFESRLVQKSGVEKSGAGGFDVVELPRARKVHQSILTAPGTSLVCLWSALTMLHGNATDIILTNGPGTGVIVVLASLILRFFAIGNSGKTRCIYIESLARCKKLSLSGRLLKPLVDRFLVQWKELEGGRAEFRGCFALDAAVWMGLDGVEGENVVDRSGWVTYDL